MQLKIDEFYAGKVIPEDDSVRLLDEIMEEMDYTELFRAYKRTGRPPATNPVTMMKILVYASMESNLASRAIESSCNRDINRTYMPIFFMDFSFVARYHSFWLQQQKVVWQVRLTSPCRRAFLHLRSSFRSTPQPYVPFGIRRFNRISAISAETRIAQENRNILPVRVFPSVCAQRFIIPFVFHTISLTEARISPVFCKTGLFTWQKRWDSNPRAGLKADRTISSRW
ncbi:hypothetical protein Sgly_0095 [Syntrophobotulus glycolicus DSM 8271]|uniref:Transposase InsH N-terminal domain-containing protein n=1 Tax=Syntrophobotulus glycolicus (strain DSM 8271 / FlGlyR) TaxID=645991 RepID=F0SVJ2_SYNGF|nr:hypothetical protein Sgly_0095 [Syntrophobotulus glycolicus DSM 8271]